LHLTGTTFLTSNSEGIKTYTATENKMTRIQPDSNQRFIIS
jgi:hypothetical protein